jgi:hypothetical protein
VKKEAPPNVLGISGLGSLQHVLQKKHYEALDYINTLESRVRELEAEIHRARTDSRYWDEFNTISRHDAIRNENDKLRARHAALVKAANKFVKKIDMVHNDPAYYGVWATSQMHIGEYKGPKYDGELDELKAELASANAMI